MLIEVNRIQAAGAAYTRLRRQSGLPPVKETLSAVPSDKIGGPVGVVCGGRRFTLTFKATGRPVPAR